MLLKYLENNTQLCLSMSHTLQWSLLYAFHGAPHTQGSSEQCYDKLPLHGPTLYLPPQWAVKFPLIISLSDFLKFYLEIPFFYFVP